MKYASWVSLHGTREERSGRYFHVTDERLAEIDAEIAAFEKDGTLPAKKWEP
jgi:hypothetical protein